MRETAMAATLAKALRSEARARALRSALEIVSRQEAEAAGVGDTTAITEGPAWGVARFRVRLVDNREAEVTVKVKGA